MKRITLFSVTFLAAIVMMAQPYNKIDTSFYSPALDDVKLVDVYFPPGYDENPDMHFPVIYYLHGWMENQNSLGAMLSYLQSMIDSGMARSGLACFTLDEKALVEIDFFNCTIVFPQHHYQWIFPEHIISLYPWQN